MNIVHGTTENAFLAKENRRHVAFVIYNRFKLLCKMMKQVIAEEGFPNPRISSNMPTTDINIFKEHFRQIEITFTDEQSGYFGTLLIFSRKIGDFLGKL